MTDFLIVIFSIVVCVFTLFVFQQWILVCLYLRNRKEILSVPIPGESPASPSDPVDLPKVTVQVPVYNERYMVERIIEATAKLDYPHNLLQIQILDDSTDDTVSIAQKAVGEWRGKGINIELIHRDHRTGFKAGALNDGLKVAHGELIAIFDADFVPHSNFLRRIICDYRAFDDPRVGFAQTRWVFLNRNKNFVTRGEALLIENHFLMDNLTRHHHGLPIIFNGSGGIWRRQSIEDAGGWELDTLTEDLDLSYRAQMKGWKAVYLPREESPNELPDNIMAFKQQFRRWSRGPAQCFRKLWWRVLFSDFSPASKISALMYVTTCFMAPLVLLLILLWPLMVLHVGFMNLPLKLHFVLPLSLIFVASSFVVHYDQGKPFSELLVDVPCSLILALGSSFSNSIAVFMGLFIRKSGVFERTPKIALSAKTEGDSSPTSNEEAFADKSGETGKLRRGKYVLNSDWTMWFDWIITIYLFVMGVIVAFAGEWKGLIMVTFYFSAFLFSSLSQANHLRRSLEPPERTSRQTSPISTPDKVAPTRQEEAEESLISRPIQP